MDKFRKFHEAYLKLQKEFGIEVTIDRDEHYERNCDDEWELADVDMYVIYKDTETGEEKKIYDDEYED